MNWRVLDRCGKNLQSDRLVGGEASWCGCQRMRPAEAGKATARFDLGVDQASGMAALLGVVFYR